MKAELKFVVELIGRCFVGAGAIKGLGILYSIQSGIFNLPIANIFQYLFGGLFIGLWIFSPIIFRGFEKK